MDGAPGLRGCEPDRQWRTRQDPFARDWEEILDMLRVMPDLQAARLLEYLQEKYPGRYEDGQVRTLQRRLRLWRAVQGPDRELFFDQVHVPGEAIQLDWTDCNCLGVCLAGRPFPHKLCHCACVYSKWEWARVCFSEDFLSLRSTLQDALLRLGGVPGMLQVDNSSAATCRLCRGESRRGFNASFRHLLDHFGLKGRKVNIGCSNENGTVEKLHDHFRRRLDQALMLRGSRQFDSQQHYEGFVLDQLERANRNRQRKTEEERRHLERLPATRYAEYQVESHRIGAGATVRVKKKVYSVPSRLKGFRVRCRIYGERIEVYLGAERVHSMARVHGRKPGIDWRDLAPALVKKPGAFARYRYREALFPAPAYRELCEALRGRLGDYAGDREYLLILNAAAGLEREPALAATGRLLSGEAVMTLEGFREAAGLARPRIEMACFVPDLSVYAAFHQELDHEPGCGDVSEELPSADHGRDG